ncbi:MAG: 50S ribosomal protein L11 methyltransferase [Candidatus Aminicenantes bacterium]|nr:50S ribosomal protein L11 methyltransferase [Candidatus Aminicenantes bacterium]
MALIIGNRFVIRRPCETGNFPGRLPIILGRGRAFGSGEHETTHSCLEELEKIPLTGAAKVLDVGCGSGILAIAAARLGAAKVVAFDPYRHAITTACGSVMLNGLEDRVLLYRGELAALKDKNYSLIMANLYGDILLGMLGELCGKLASGGLLLLSGILYEYAFDIKEKAPAYGCELEKAHYLEEYTTLIFKRGRPPSP